MQTVSSNVRATRLSRIVAGERARSEIPHPPYATKISARLATTSQPAGRQERADAKPATPTARSIDNRRTDADLARCTRNSGRLASGLRADRTIIIKLPPMPPETNLG